jgi:hypothetical protein
MDNALIDDRRIHVDFSQSVSKLWSQYRRKDNQMGKGKNCNVIFTLVVSFFQLIYVHFHALHDVLALSPCSFHSFT